MQDLRVIFSGPPGRAHLMGVCGVGVAGVARLLAAHGWQVSGCDAAPGGAIAQWLEAHGIAVVAGHDARHIAAPDGRRNMLIHTAAVPSDHPEIVRAREAGWTVCRRGEALAALVDLGRGVAVCGAHGKTTTTCFATRLLQELGAAPSWCIGGATATLGGVAGVGNSDLLVVEADESDGTLARYHPAVTVLNNIDLDHLEHFTGEADLVDCYRQAVRQTRLGLAYGADDSRACDVARAFRGPAIPFGFCEQAALRAVQVELRAGGVSFSVIWEGRELGRVSLGVPGRHNVLNALGALAAGLLLGHDAQAALAGLPAAAELPARRFERLAAGSGIQVISDYAHHPAEIAALVATAVLQGARRVLAVFQPHRYTRTRALGTAFPEAFAGVDELVLVPVYAASEAPLEAGGIADLHAHFRRLQPGMPVLLARSMDEAWAGLRRQLQPGDLLLVVGAGNVVQIAGWAAEALRSGAWGENSPIGSAGTCLASPAICASAEALRQIEGLGVSSLRSLAPLTFYGVGGPADVVAEVATPAALGALLAWTAAHGVPVHRLGQGANTWASDLGVAGVVVRLRGEAFRNLVRQGDEVVVGCGWNGPALLDRLESEGLSGLEFLEGVPGQVGGWLAMNAGAHGGELRDAVKDISCLDAAGRSCAVTAAEAGFRYRGCEALTRRIAWQVTLRLKPDAPEAIRQRRQNFREKRLPLAGLRTAGSVFCNPPGDFAGRLLDAAGCKGLRVGGARVSEGHANIVVAMEGATASDVLALLALMRQRVQARSGIRLELENRMLGLPAGTDGLAMD
ncbi:MAG: UDP-N-acetylmuramate--L-alanine ligase [bacterium]